jgi:predicted transcriptional regulator YdeE
MQEYSHQQFQVSGYKVTITNQADSQKIIQDAWHKFMQEGLFKLVEHKAYPHVHTIYYNYHDIGDPAKFGYDMVLGFATIDGTTQTNPDFVTVTIPSQDYKFTKISGNFQEVLPAEWVKINNMPKSELDRDYGYDMDMYSEDKKTCTIAVSINK